MANARLYGFWGSLTEALRTGEPQNEAKSGEDFFGDALRRPGPAGRSSCAAMTAISARRGAWRSPRSSLGDHKTVIDIGCAAGRGAGAGRAARTRTSPGGGFDLPAVEPIFDEYVGRLGLGDRLRFHAGDFFADRCRRADVLVMGHILHDWDLDAEADAAAEGLRRAARRRRADRLRGPDRRRPPGERVRPADEPQHADRDARRLRLHRRRLPRLDARGRVLARATSSTWSAPTR